MHAQSYYKKQWIITLKIFEVNNKDISKFTSQLNIYLLKFENGKTRKMCEICSKLTMNYYFWTVYSMLQKQQV